MEFNKNINIHIKDHQLCCILRQIGLYGLILLFCLNMATTAYAAEKNKNISDGNLVRVDISWGEMQFTYVDEHELWDPSTHTYSKKVPASWTAEENWIAVENSGTEGAVHVTLTSKSNVGSIQGLFKADGSADNGSENYFIELGAGKSQKLWFELIGSITMSYEVLGEIFITVVAQ